MSPHQINLTRMGDQRKAQPDQPSQFEIAGWHDAYRFPDQVGFHHWIASS